MEERTKERSHISCCSNRPRPIPSAAIKTLLKSIADGDARSAVALLKGIGMLSAPRPGLTVPAMMSREMEDYERQEALEEKARRRRVPVDDEEEQRREARRRRLRAKRELAAGSQGDPHNNDNVSAPGGQ